MGHVSFQVQASVETFSLYWTGITLASTTTRRPPNAMNFIRQLEVLQKSGDETDFTADRIWMATLCCNLLAMCTMLKVKVMIGLCVCQWLDNMNLRTGTEPRTLHVHFRSGTKNPKLCRFCRQKLTSRSWQGSARRSVLEA